MIVKGSPFSRFPVLFARLKGRNGSTRELKALVDPATDYCVMPKPDAFRLGYTEAAQDDPITTPPNLVTLASSGGYSQGMLIKMCQVSVNTFTLNDVDFLAYDLQQSTCYDMILGRSFFLPAKLRVEIDYASRQMNLRAQQQLT